VIDTIERAAHHPWAGMGLSALAVCLLFWGCAPDTPPGAGPAAEPTLVTSKGFTIPLFATATEQLSYAKSLVANPLEKSAALNLVIERFPQDRRYRGETRLELAYLHLGRDFRLADQQTCLRALSAYEEIAHEFAELPAIRAKAYWYMAWIYTDLLKDKRKGMALYALLAEKHPEDSFSRIFPVPWLKLVFPDPKIKPYTADDRYSHSWAGLALLEIVRNADNPETQKKAFQKLWLDHRDSLTTGYALKEILRSGHPMDDMAALIGEYVRGNTINTALNKDLLAGLAQWESYTISNRP
jgi:hypothetical protein